MHTFYVTMSRGPINRVLALKKSLKSDIMRVSLPNVSIVEQELYFLWLKLYSRQNCNHKTMMNLQQLLFLKYDRMFMIIC